MDNLGKSSNGKYRHTLYTTKWRWENQMENAVLDSEEDGKRVLYIRCFIERCNFNRNTHFYVQNIQCKTQRQTYVNKHVLCVLIETCW